MRTKRLSKHKQDEEKQSERARNREDGSSDTSREVKNVSAKPCK